MEKSCQQFVKQWIAMKNGMDTGEVDAKTNMFERGYLDSLQAYTLILELEEMFEVDFDEAAIAGNDVSTIEDLCKLVRKIRNG